MELSSGPPYPLSHVHVLQQTYCLLSGNPGAKQMRVLLPSKTPSNSMARYPHLLEMSLCHSVSTAPLQHLESNLLNFVAQVTTPCPSWEESARLPIAPPTHQAVSHESILELFGCKAFQCITG